MALVYKVFHGYDDLFPKVQEFVLSGSIDDITSDIMALCEWVQVSQGALIYNHRVFVSATLDDFVARVHEDIDFNLDIVTQHF